jgi:hypothetical protein
MIQGQNCITDKKKRSLSPKKVTNQLRKKDKYGGKYRIHSATIHPFFYHNRFTGEFDTGFRPVARIPLGEPITRGSVFLPLAQ